MIQRLPERARTPAVARAITSPGGILLAGAGASVAILAGAPLAAAAVVGALAWVGRVAVAVPRQAKPVLPDPAAVQEPWRSLVRQAQKAETRFDQVVASAEPGPLRDRLTEVGGRVAVGVEECWRIAQRGNALRTALDGLGVGDLHRQLEEGQAAVRRAPDRPDLGATVDAVRQQLASADRLAAVAQDAEDRLRRLAAQLNEAVARAVELSLKAPDLGTLQPLGNDVDSLVGELESLRSALEETSRDPSP